MPPKRVNVPCPDCAGSTLAIRIGHPVQCAQCGTRYSVRRHPDSGYARLYRVRQFRTIGASRKAGKPKDALINGQVECAVCRRKHHLADTIDGKIETDRLQRIQVPAGWHVVGEFSVNPTLVEIMEERKIPAIIRGRICNQCVLTYNTVQRRIDPDHTDRIVRRVAGEDDRAERRLRIPIVRIEREISASSGRFHDDRDAVLRTMERHHVRPDGTMWIERNTFYSATPDPFHLDPCPEWAHSGDPSWINPRLIVRARYPRGLNTGWWYRDESTGLWQFVPARVLAHDPEDRMIDTTRPDPRYGVRLMAPTFDPIREIDRCRATKPISLSQFDRPEVTTVGGLIGPARYVTSYRPLRACTATLRMPPPPALGLTIYHVQGRCYHGLTPITCVVCRDPRYRPASLPVPSPPRRHVPDPPIPVFPATLHGLSPVTVLRQAMYAAIRIGDPAMAYVHTRRLARLARIGPTTGT